MTTPQPYRVVAGLRVPLQLVPTLITAIRAKYPEVTAGIADPDAAVRAALRHWIQEIYTEYAVQIAEQPLASVVARAVTEYEARAVAAKQQAQQSATLITDDDGSTT